MPRFAKVSRANVRLGKGYHYAMINQLSTFAYHFTTASRNGVPLQSSQQHHSTRIGRNETKFFCEVVHTTAICLSLWKLSTRLNLYTRTGLSCSWYTIHAGSPWPKRCCEDRWYHTLATQNILTKENSPSPLLPTKTTTTFASIPPMW